ncbi:HWE histidine kinase domain-containing protein [Erythrobacter sp.]|jgi:light-regulated signal transduction histidine kinase (bacteriophytochrome)/CheY-like chemotaxis protein|uniref:HWE histidine kinase domain-containing protein n=1 Tax=Erythrobacter sp. TaxID=1042 RepID=UPI002EA1ED05|nr:HWE histidine kinase domain-containing protein [Erythrobacter sp.]
MNFERRQPTLTDCDRERIHEIGMVQAFGGLIALDFDWVIVQRSANCGEILNLEQVPQAGTPLSSILYPKAMDQLRAAVGRLALPDQVERMFGIRLNSGGPLVDVAVHRTEDRLLIEFEPHDAGAFTDHLAMVGPLIARLESIREPQQLFTTATRLVRQMLGYDRVMIYRFHRDYSGEVIAEDRRGDKDSFLGLRYPHSDIPMQARELFRRNRFRVIADVDGAQAAIEPDAALDGEPLDLSMSVLRASSPIHLQYLRNMGVAASMTIAIVRGGELWGLISCHHDTPRLPSYSLRTVAEMFSQTFSLMLDRMLIAGSGTLRGRGRELHDQLMMRFAGGTSLGDNLDLITASLGELIAHDGISTYIDGEYRSEGAAPDADEFEALLPGLSSAPSSKIFATPDLSQYIAAAADFSHTACGALLLPISRNTRDYLVLWRKPLTQSVLWSGNPAKAVVAGEDRLMPRSSFVEWAETVEGRSEEWTDDEIVIAEGLRVTLLEVILRMTDEAARERKRTQEQQDLLIAELNHRVRNILNLIRGLVSQSQRDAIGVENFAEIVGGRIAALATAHDNITRENWSPASLATLIESEMQAYLQGKTDRLKMTNADVMIRPEAYTVLALVMHELVTNSAKYGSLCDSKGSVDIAIDREANGDLTIAWRERGGPPVKPPRHRGFGSTIIQRSIPHELRGEAELNFKLTGLEADFRIPARFVAPPGADTHDGKSAAALDARGDADAGIGKETGEATRDGDRDESASKDVAPPPEFVMVVEDNMIIALDTEDILLELGVAKVRVESTVAGALDAIAEGQPDFAIVDFNLGTESSLPVAEELAKRGVRFVLASGYSELARDLDEYGAEALIRKPYGSDEIENALAGRSAEAD